jgi:hypothetical protein
MQFVGQFKRCELKKKEPSSKSEFIRNVLLYREDIEEIMHLFKSKEMQITISDSGFEYAELDEVTKQRGNCPRELDISGKVPGNNYGSVSIAFSSDRTHVHAWGSGTPRELCYELIEFLKKHRSWEKRILRPFLWYFVTLIAFNVEVFGLLQTTVRSKTPWWVHAALTILIASWPLCYAYSRTLSTVRLTRRTEGGFWSRNREALVLLAIGAMLGGVVTYIVTILTK